MNNDGYVKIMAALVEAYIRMDEWFDRIDKRFDIFDFKCKISDIKYELGSIKRDLCKVERLIFDKNYALVRDVTNMFKRIGLAEKQIKELQVRLEQQKVAA